MYRKCMIRPLFKKYQKELLKFCNTDNGRSFLLDNWGGKADGQIIKVTPDSFHEVKDSYEDKLIVQATFFPCSPYIKKFAEMLTYLDIMGQTDIPLNELGRYIYLTSPETFNPEAHPETTSVDGRVWVAAQNAIWGTVRNTTGNNAADNEVDVDLVYADSTTTTNQYATILRGIFLFDTSSLTTNAIISAATISFYGTAKSNGLVFTDAHASIALVSSNPAVNIALANTDFNVANFGSTRYISDFSYAAYSTSAYNDMTLNADGRAAIAKTGITKFGTMFACDLDNSTPAWATGTSTGIRCYYADNGSNKPKLVVTYTLSTGGFIGIL